MFDRPKPTVGCSANRRRISRAYSTRVVVYCYLMCYINCVVGHIFQREIQEGRLKTYHTAPCTVQKHRRIELKTLTTTDKSLKLLVFTIYIYIYIYATLNEGITMCLDTYYDINIVRQHNCFYYTR